MELLIIAFLLLLTYAIFYYLGQLRGLQVAKALITSKIAKKPLSGLSERFWSIDLYDLDKEPGEFGYPSELSPLPPRVSGLVPRVYFDGSLHRMELWASFVARGGYAHEYLKYSAQYAVFSKLGLQLENGTEGTEEWIYYVP